MNDKEIDCCECGSYLETERERYNQECKRCTARYHRIRRGFDMGELDNG